MFKLRVHYGIGKYHNSACVGDISRRCVQRQPGPWQYSGGNQPCKGWGTTDCGQGLYISDDYVPGRQMRSMGAHSENIIISV
jgi:hypothetical protein